MVIHGGTPGGDPGIEVVGEADGPVDVGAFGRIETMYVVRHVALDVPDTASPSHLGDHARWVVDNARHSVTFARTPEGADPWMPLHMSSDAAASFEVGDEVTFHLRLDRYPGFGTLVAITPTPGAPSPGPR